VLFTSNIFLYAFLPAVVALFFVLARVDQKTRVAIWFLILSSFIFYGYKNPANIILLMGSILGNFALASQIRRHQQKTAILALGILFNLGILGYFKYTNFLLENLNFISGDSYTPLSIALPLAISFYTFQQIAFLADTKNEEVGVVSFRDYLLFVTFFPQLIIGPIVHHKEMMPQFSMANFGRFNWQNFQTGFLYLMIGVIKKVFLSDACALVVNSVHGDISNGVSIGFADAWVAAFAFSLQIYFDFSGYTDMAVGIAKMLGIDLPFNFNSPYKARNVGEFWRRWHMTLSRWLRNYLYIPLGGNHSGFKRAAINAVIVFLLGGLWHGAAWTFIAWGLMQGIGVVWAHLMKSLKIGLPTSMGILFTFIFITLSWVLFRAQNMEDAWNLYQVMGGVQGFDLTLRDSVNLPVMAIGAIIIFGLPNSHIFVPWLQTRIANLPTAPVVVVVLVSWLALAAFDLDSSAAFIYFDF